MQQRDMGSQETLTVVDDEIGSGETLVNESIDDAEAVEAVEEGDVSQLVDELVDDIEDPQQSEDGDYDASESADDLEDEDEDEDEDDNDEEEEEEEESLGYSVHVGEDGRELINIH